jgi:hypothetical protein
VAELGLAMSTLRVPELVATGLIVGGLLVIEL